MRESEIKKLIKLVEESDISELEVSRWGKKVIVRKYPSSQDSSIHSAKPQREGQTVVLPTEQQRKKQQSETAEEQLHEIKSPMVGTFYRSPAPNAKDYVKQNDRITIGQVVCVIEAMKIMNEIESDVGGTIVAIPVESSAPVEYGQTLFLVRPD